MGSSANLLRWRQLDVRRATHIRHRTHPQSAATITAATAGRLHQTSAATSTAATAITTPIAATAAGDHV